MTDFDVVIIGSGVGGGAVAMSLAGSGARVLIVERGGRLPREPQNADAEAVFVERRYRANETWVDAAGQTFNPGQFYFVGGHTKFYGTAMFRFRERDFDATEHEDGISPSWPVRYAELEPYYAQAERLFGVHGRAGDDPNEPARSTAYPYPPIPHEPLIARFAERFAQAGLRPFHMPSAVDLHAGGRCMRCSTCDAFPCPTGAKGDAERCLIDPALRDPDMTLLTHAHATRLIADDAGRRIVGAELDVGGAMRVVRAPLVVLSAGAVNSALLLQRSASVRHPDGLANTCGMVGRNYMNHNTTALLGLLPWTVNDTRFTKTLSLNDFYFGCDDDRTPLGNLQMLGNINEPMIRAAKPSLPRVGAS